MDVADHLRATKPAEQRVGEGGAGGVHEDGGRQLPEGLEDGEHRADALQEQREERIVAGFEQPAVPVSKTEKVCMNLAECRLLKVPDVDELELLRVQADAEALVRLGENVRGRRVRVPGVDAKLELLVFEPKASIIPLFGKGMWLSQVTMPRLDSDPNGGLH